MQEICGVNPRKQTFSLEGEGSMLLVTRTAKTTQTFWRDTNNDVFEVQLSPHLQEKSSYLSLSAIYPKGMGARNRPHPKKHFLNKVFIFCSQSKSTWATLGNHATQESANVVQLGGVGNSKIQSTLGTYNIKMPMFNGRVASLSDICLEEITTTFPQYPLQEAFKNICKSFKSIDSDVRRLPNPSSSVGGTIHFTIGVKYLRYHPRLIHQLPSGLGIYESAFTNQEGGRGVNPHPVFTKIQQAFLNQSELLCFCSNQYFKVRNFRGFTFCGLFREIFQNFSSAKVYSCENFQYSSSAKV